MWIHTDGIANIFSLKNMTKRFKVTYDSEEGEFHVHTPTRIMCFVCSKVGLHYYDIAAPADQPYPKKPAVAMTQQGECQVIDTVSGRAAHFSKREIVGARRAVRSMALTGGTTRGDLRATVRLNAVKNLNLTVTDVDNALKVFGPDPGGLQGRTARERPLGTRSD